MPFNTTTPTPPLFCKRNTVTPSPCTTVPICTFGTPNEIAGPSVKTALLTDLMNIATSNNIPFNPNATNLKALCVSLALAIRDKGVNCTQNDFQKLTDSSDYGFSLACEVGSEICGNFYAPPTPCTGSSASSGSNPWKLAAIHMPSSSSSFEVAGINKNLFVYNIPPNDFYGIYNLNKTVLFDQTQADFSIYATSSTVLSTYGSDVMFFAQNPTIYAINVTSASGAYNMPMPTPPSAFTISLTDAGCYGPTWPSISTQNFFIFSCNSNCYGFDIHASGSFNIKQRPSAVDPPYFRIYSCDSIQYSKSADLFFVKSPYNGVFLLNASSILGTEVDLSNNPPITNKVINNDGIFYSNVEFRGSINNTLIFQAFRASPYSTCALCTTMGSPANNAALCDLVDSNSWDIAGEYIVTRRNHISFTFTLDAIKACSNGQNPCVTSAQGNTYTHFINGDLYVSSNNVFITSSAGQPVLKGGLSIYNLTHNLPSKGMTAYEPEEIISIAGFNITAPVFYYGESPLTNETIFADIRNTWYYIVPNSLLTGNVSKSLFSVPTIQRTPESYSISLLTKFNGQNLEVDGHPTLIAKHVSGNMLMQVDVFIHS